MTKPIVIKVGGALLEAESAASQFFTQLSLLKDVNPIVVHGGGAQVQAMLKDLGFTSEKHLGMRITPDAHMPIVTGILAGSANKQLVAMAQAKSCKAVGISILDGNLMHCERISESLGCVGAPTTVNPKLVSELVENNWLPIVSSIGSDSKGQLLNINADHAASALAVAMACPLVLLSDVSSVLNENKARIPTISPDDMQELIDTKVIVEGMKVKVESAMDTAKKTNRSVTIAGWKDNINDIINGRLGTQVHAHKGPII